MSGDCALMSVQNAMQFVGPFPRFRNKLALTLGVTYAMLTEKIRQENTADVEPADIWVANSWYVIVV